MMDSAPSPTLPAPGLPTQYGQHELAFGGALLWADRSGALWWPEQSTLLLADLHLEKGSAFARAGQMIPPYDSGATLARLARLIETHAPARIVCLGDSFHDGGAEQRLPPAYRAALARLIEGREWLWVRGNHDPEAPAALGGLSVLEAEIGGLTLRHQAASHSRPEVSGHFHPKASIRARNQTVTGRCFVFDQRRLILPAFGAYAGGLSVRAPALRHLFAEDARVLIIGTRRLFAFALDKVN